MDMGIAEIRSRLDSDIRNEMDGAARGRLSDAVEVAAWVEPLGECYEILSEDGRDLYIAGLNYTYETVMVNYEFRFQKRALALSQYCDGTLIVPWTMEAPYGLNFDRWRIEVGQPGLRDDCIGTWRADVQGRTVTETTLTRLGAKLVKPTEADRSPEPAIRTVVVVDLVDYTRTVRILEQNTTSATTAGINRQIQGIIDLALKSVGAKRKESVIKTTGDGAILMFPDSEIAHRFAEALHAASADHNAGKTEPTAKRWFTSGAATGEIAGHTAPDGVVEYAGVAIADASRLQSQSGAGELVIDIVTFDSLPPDIRRRYGPEEQVPGKRDETYVVRRCRMIDLDWTGTPPTTRK
jgi:class 3 adenylate cyclase